MTNQMKHLQCERPAMKAAVGIHSARAAIVGIVCLAGMSLASLAQAKQEPLAEAYGCGERLKLAMSRDPATEVLLVKQFRKGDSLVLKDASPGANSAAAVEGGKKAGPPIAGSDLCLVKLLIGPGNPGPKDAASTSSGIGIEVLLPSSDRWNQRIRAYGNSGWSGTPQADRSAIASDDLHVAAAAKGYVVATSDNGHAGSPINGSFAMSPDGGINTTGWQDFSERSLHELAEKTKLLTKYFYGRSHQYAYWDGFSTGGRQGLKLAQAFPNDFDGILVGAPAINWSRYHTAGLYASISMQQDLGYSIAPEKLNRVTAAALAACGGATLGFLIDPLSCRYDPSQDASILCTEKEASNRPAGATSRSSCLTKAEAVVINKIWYGQTADGAAPSPASDNGNTNLLEGKRRLWFGWTRGTDLKSTPAGGAPGQVLAADQTALELQDPELGSPLFKNATGHGKNQWLHQLDYAGLANAQSKGELLQPQFSHINTDSPDLRQFSKAEGKIVMYQGLADEYIPPQGAMNYYERVIATMGGAEGVSQFYRFYLIPGFTHSGRSEGLPFVPVPQPVSGRDEMFSALLVWVEQDAAPGNIVVKSSDLSTSLPLCPYPQKAVYGGVGSVRTASSYVCR